MLQQITTALAAAMSQCLATVSFIAMAVWKNPFFRFQQKDFAIDMKIVKDIFGLGLPVAG